MLLYYFLVHRSTTVRVKNFNQTVLHFQTRARFPRCAISSPARCYAEITSCKQFVRQYVQKYGRITYRFLNNTFHIIYIHIISAAVITTRLFHIAPTKNDYLARCSNGVVLCTSVSSLRSHNNNDNNNMISYLASSDYPSVQIYRLRRRTLENVINSIF